jgi:bifunctional non-homologous end joining protein LigD
MNAAAQVFRNCRTGAQADLSLRERKQMLDEIGTHFSDPLHVNPLFRTELAPLIRQVKTLGLEGIVAKRAGSIYVPGRESDAWQKHRFNREGEFVIGGYVTAGNSFSSVIVGEYWGKDLNYVKRVAAGFNGHLRAQVFRELQSAPDQLKEESPNTRNSTLRILGI